MPAFQNNFARNFLSFCRQIHSTSSLMAYDKQLLAKLRKNTGFAIVNCKKALELHENDFEKAEEWVRKEAEKQGWEKALKLGNRPTPQGLIGVCINNNIGAIAELNCETDFVARNENFQVLLDDVMKTLSNIKTQGVTDSIIKEHFDFEQLRSLPARDDKTLGDLIAATIGRLSEKISLHRATVLHSSPGVQLFSYAHPSTIESPSFMGQYGAILAVRNPPDDRELLYDICSNIVGKNPTSIGSLDDEVKPEGEEKRLIYQTLLSDPEITVKDVLLDTNMEILDFIRYHCGETAKSEGL